jgi:purine-binding chemotaxis protein CheW
MADRPPAARPAAERPEASTAAERPAASTAAERPEARPAAERPEARPAAERSQASTTAERSQANLAATQSATRRFLTFRLGDRLYALPGEDVAEIILIPPVARLPHSPKSLMGLANLRGTVLPMVDPRVMLNMEHFAAGKSSRAIVCAASGAAPVALAVDKVDAFVTVAREAVETGQTEIVSETGERLRGAFWAASGQDEAAKILDLPAMLGAEFGARAQPRPRSRVATATAAPDAAAVAREQRLLVSFAVAGQDYALGLDEVREIVPLPRSIAVVPKAETVLLGMIAYRDRLLPLLSLRGLLGFSVSETFAGDEKVIVMLVGGVLVGLVADRMRAIIRANTGDIDSAPAMLAARTGGEAKITAIYRGDGGRLVSVLAAEHLFREDVMRRLGDNSMPADPTTALPARALLRFVVFQLGLESFALPINAVDEVARLPEQITRVPKTPKFLEGVINLRGQVLPVVDQRRRFDMPRYDGASMQRLIVVRTERHRAGLIVDSVSEVLRAAADTIEPPPDLAREAGDESARLISGVINEAASGRMILLLDPAELLTRAERGMLDDLDLEANDDATGQTAA